MSSHRPAGEGVNPDFIETFEVFDNLGYVALAATAIPRRVAMDEVREASRSGVGTFGTHNFLFVEAARVDEILAACVQSDTGAPHR